MIEAVENLVLNEEKTVYGQVQQSIPCTYAPLRELEDGYKQMCKPFLCRDFFHEVQAAQFYKEDAPRIYGFKAKYIPDWKGQYSVCLKGLQRKITKNFERLLRNFEEEFGVKETLLYWDNESKSMIVVPTDERLYKTIPLYSLFTLLPRLAYFSDNFYEAHKLGFKNNSIPINTLGSDHPQHGSFHYLRDYVNGLLECGGEEGSLNQLLGCTGYSDQVDRLWKQKQFHHHGSFGYATNFRSATAFASKFTIEKARLKAAA